MDVRVLTLLAPTPQNGHTHAIRWLLPANCLSVFDHFVGLAFYATVLDVNLAKRDLFLIFFFFLLFLKLFFISLGSNVFSTRS